MGDVVAAAARVDHGGDEVQVHDVGELARLLQTVEAPHLQQLAHDLVGALVTPRVDHRHADIVDEDGQFLAGRRAVSVAHSFVHAAFDVALLKNPILIRLQST